MKVLQDYELLLDHILMGVTVNAFNMVKLMDELKAIFSNFIDVNNRES